jgi:hypothetical protein
MRTRPPEPAVSQRKVNTRVISGEGGRSARGLLARRAGARYGLRHAGWRRETQGGGSARQYGQGGQQRRGATLCIRATRVAMEGRIGVVPGVQSPCVMVVAGGVRAGGHRLRFT